MLGLLQRKPKPRGRMDIRCATQVFDAVPCNIFEPLEVHDLLIHAEPLLVKKGLAHHQVQQLLRLDPDPEQ